MVTVTLWTMSVKNELISYKFCDTLKSFRLFLTVKTILILNMEHSIKLEIEILYINHRHSCSRDNVKFGHFMVLQRPQRNLQCIVIVLLMKPFV